MTPHELLALLHTAEKLKDTTRHCDTSGGRRESVAEHSWRIALMAFWLRDEFPQADMDKVTAIYNYIAGHDTYDTKLANDITSGKVSKYIPDTAATLNSNKDICYDLASLFAAMCRSQDIPCTLTKGCAGSSYHAWNKVNISGNWYQIDMTYAVTKRVINETTFASCVSPLTCSQQSDTLAVSAVA